MGVDDKIFINNEGRIFKASEMKHYVETEAISKYENYSGKKVAKSY